MTVKLSAPVRTKAGRVTTIAALADEGLITFEAIKRKRMWERNRRMAYFACMPDGYGWKISKTAYLSRTGQNF